MARKVKRSGSKSDVNKSQTIRDYKSNHPDAKPKQIATALKKEGLSVTPQYVSTILSTAKRKSSQGGIENFKNLNLSAEDLILVKQLVASTGSVQSAKKAVDLYEQLMV